MGLDVFAYLIVTPAISELFVESVGLVQVATAPPTDGVKVIEVLRSGGVSSTWTGCIGVTSNGPTRVDSPPTASTWETLTYLFEKLIAGIKTGLVLEV